MIYHSVKLAPLTCVITKNSRGEQIDMRPYGKGEANVLRDIFLIRLSHTVGKALVDGMLLTESDDTAAGLNEEHIEYLVIKAAEMLLNKLPFKYENTYRCVSRYCLCPDCRP